MTRLAGCRYPVSADFISIVNQIQLTNYWYPNRRAYNRTAHLEGRAKMMQEWTDYLEDLQLKAAPH